MSLNATLRGLARQRLAALVVGALALAACGGGGYGHDPYYYDEGPYVIEGTVVAENDTATVPETVMHDFRMWFAGDPPSGGNLLSAPLFPGEWEVVASVFPDYYDADAFMSDGVIDYLEVWSSVFVEGGVETTFFAY